MMVIFGYLPPPPGTELEPTPGPSVLEVVLIVVAILGAVTLLAWILKPLVAKRLRAAETTLNDTAGKPAAESRQWSDSWQASHERIAERQDAAAEIANVDRLSPVSTEGRVEGDAPPNPESLTASTAPVVDVPPVSVGHDSADIAGITETVRTLLERANTGRVREGFALYSKGARERFRADTGMTVAEFATAFDDIPPPPRDQQAELAAVTDIERLPDGRIRALIKYRNGGSTPSPEYFTFVRSISDAWLIDEIETARLQS